MSRIGDEEVAAVAAAMRRGEISGSFGEETMSSHQTGRRYSARRVDSGDTPDGDAPAGVAAARQGCERRVARVAATGVGWVGLGRGPNGGVVILHGAIGGRARKHARLRCRLGSHVALC